MGTVFLRGLRRIVFGDVRPTLTMLRFQQTKELLCYSYVIIRMNDRIFKLFVSEEL